MVLGKKDKRVIECFTEKLACEGHKLSTNGERLDGVWMGGHGIAEWVRGKIVFHDLGSRSAQTVQRAVARAVPKSWLA